MKKIISLLTIFILSLTAVGQTNSFANVKSSNLFKLEGVVNSRDIGGYKNIYGRTIKKNKVLRTAALATLTYSGKTKLVKHNLKTIVDLRTFFEVFQKPDVKIEGVSNINRDIVGKSVITGKLAWGANDLVDTYKAFVADPNAREGFSNALKDIIYSKGLTIFHCTAGKDRTGWLAAIIYEILQLDRKQIINDYLLSNKYWNVSANDPINGVQKKYILTSYFQVKKLFGNFQNYLKKGLNITSQEIKILRSKFL